MQYKVMSNKGDREELFVEDDQTVEEVLTLIKLMLGLSEEQKITVTLLGKKIVVAEDEDEYTWGEYIDAVVPTARKMQGAKLYVVIEDGARVRQDGMNAQQLQYEMSKEHRSEADRLKREQARQMEPMIEAMANNPELMESLLSANPAAKRLMDKNPEAAREMRNPELLKEVMMASLDPDKQREMNRAIQSQMAQIGAIPDGQQLMDRKLNSMMEDMERAENLAAARANGTDAEPVHTHPTRDNAAFTQALPNPWASPETPSATSSPYPTGQGSQAAMMQALFGQPPSTTSNSGNSYNTGGAAGPSAFDPQQIMAMMSMMQTMQNMQAQAPQQAQAEQTATTSAEERTDYSSQLEQLHDMGFEDDAKLLETLIAVNGDVEEAVLRLAELQDEQEETGNGK